MNLLLDDNPKIIKKLVLAIRRRVGLHHQLYSAPIISTLWEETLHRSLGDIGIKTDWEPDENHGQGKDMTLLSTGERISCKSGRFKYATRLGISELTLSGSRMTEHKTLKEKRRFLEEKREDSYALLSRHQKDKTGEAYKFIMFPSSLLDYDSLNWVSAGRDGKSYAAENNLLKCKIQHSMSDQLWSTIKDYDKHPKILVIDI